MLSLQQVATVVTLRKHTDSTDTNGVTRIPDIYTEKRAQQKPVISVEFFPPKTQRGDENLFQHVLPELVEVQPDFIRGETDLDAENQGPIRDPRSPTGWSISFEEALQQQQDESRPSGIAPDEEFVKDEFETTSVRAGETARVVYNPEETIYFVERVQSDIYAPFFYINLICNFFFPFLFLMTRASKRHTRFLKIACPVILFGHFIDFYLMVTPGVLKENGGFGFMEIGVLIVYLSLFLYVILHSLSTRSLVAKNHPMLEESLHHDI